MSNEMPDEIWVSDVKGTGNSGVWSRYETPHVSAGRSGKITKSTRKTRFPRFKYIRADKAVPDGWKLVPIEPTEEMIEVGWDEFNIGCFAPLTRAYKKMLSAAPQPPTKGD